MRKNTLIGATALTLSLAHPAFAQSVAAAKPADSIGKLDEIVVTAQRKSQLLQDVPISVSAVSGAQLDKLQIRSSSDLQLSLPNITFTKTNFTTASFTIRGIGDLCTGTTCDTATASHINEMPLISTRFYETEYYDLERIEILRGPQGTLFGRNATSGVVDTLTEFCEQRRQFDTQSRIHAWLHAWLCVHLPLSVGMFVLMLVHTVVALYYI